MATDAPPVEQAESAAPLQTNYLTHTKGFKSWALTLDHKRIGVMYLVGVLSAFLLGGIFAMLIRTEMLTPGPTIMAAHTYNQVFTLHGAVMVFLFIIPSVPAALGNFVLPVMLGAKDVAFPKLNLTSFYLWVTGAILFVGSILATGLDTGWTFYTPYSIGSKGTTGSGQMATILATLGAFVLGFSSIFTGLNFIVTVHTMRPPGMTWFRMPLFLWAIYSTAIIQVLATPVLGITLLLLVAERVMHIGIFDPALGGDPVLYQHFFWFYSHPAVYIMILPAFGIISELISVFARKKIFGYTFIAMSSVAIALFGFIVWGHHMFTSGQSALVTAIFSALTFSVAIPSAVKVFNWVATLYKGKILHNTPMLYALAFVFLFTIGGLTGLYLGALAGDIHLHDTYFIVAHFHYVMMGGTMIAFLGGMYYWWPKMTGKMYSEFWGKIGCALVFLGFNLTFIPQFVLGFLGMPRRYFNYVGEFQSLHVASSIGAYILAGGLVIAAGTFFHSMFKGRKATANPWGAATLEWQTPSPPPHNNFDAAPEVGHPYDLENVIYNEKTGDWEVMKKSEQAEVS